MMDIELRCCVSPTTLDHLEAIAFTAQPPCQMIVGAIVGCRLRGRQPFVVEPSTDGEWSID